MLPVHFLIEMGILHRQDSPVVVDEAGAIIYLFGAAE